MSFRPIAISLSPNTEKEDVLLALKVLLSPNKWQDEKEVKKLELEFTSRFGKKYKAIAVNSGRSAQYLILKALGIGKGDEVVVQAFTCVAVPNSVIWLGARPVYVDIDETYNIDVADLKKKISNRTRAIIVQHTFGIPANFHAIKKIIHSVAKESGNRRIYIIEDCSHSLGSKYKEKLLGTIGDISFFSFGRDKILSSVFGGMILCSDKTLYERIKKLRDGLTTPSANWVAQQLFHPIAFSFILPVYNLGPGRFGVGKLMLYLFQKLKLLSKPVYKKEEIGKKPEVFPRQMVGAQAILARNQLKKLDRFSKQREMIANFYATSLSDLNLHIPKNIKDVAWLRLPIRHRKARQLYDFAKKKGILLGDWYRGIIVPAQKLELIRYKIGSCPRAESFAREIVNLPTYPTLTIKEARKVVQLIRLWLNIKQEK